MFLIQYFYSRVSLKLQLFKFKMKNCTHALTMFNNSLVFICTRRDCAKFNFKVKIKVALAMNIDTIWLEVKRSNIYIYICLTYISVWVNQGPRSNFEIEGGGGGGGKIHFFLLTLYNFKNIGDAYAPSPCPPYSTVPVNVRGSCSLQSLFEDKANTLLNTNFAF